MASASAPTPAYAQPAPQFRYAGFWRRFVAMVIDGLVLSPILLIILASSGLFGLMSGATGDRNMAGLGAALLGIGIVLGLVVYLVSSWLYHAWMESSGYQATLGKMALGIIVTDLNGHRISFSRANGRFFGKWVSGAVMNVGYLMAAFTEKKQALHDILASCLVVLK
ncbi:MAG TPA: RDD family protein [Bryobacteraceae bacterium]|nr:RDD family protein [Bryobacteraceae bacterium]